MSGCTDYMGENTGFQIFFLIHQKSSTRRSDPCLHNLPDIGIYDEVNKLAELDINGQRLIHHTHRYSVDAATSVLTATHAMVFIKLMDVFMCGALFIRRTHRNLWPNLGGDQPTTAVSHHSSDPPQCGQLCLPQGLGKRQLWQGMMHTV